jgi:hypothetical protein
MFRHILVLLVAVFAIVQACEDALCNNPDFGSCGNACCKLSFSLPSLSTEKAMNTLNSTIHSHGPDSLWNSQMTAEGTSGFADLRPYSKPVDFIGQAFHTTKNGMYVDTINLTIAPVENGSKIVGFSLSQIGGAYGDDGQNYFNLMSLVQAAFPDVQPQHMDGSCPSA